MLYYFRLKFKIVNRKLTEFGVHPIIGYCILLAVFLFLTERLFLVTKYASSIYASCAMYIMLYKTANKNADFMKMNFSKKDCYLIRLIENLAVSVPFISVLIYKHFYIETAILFFISFIFALITTSVKFNKTIPTPFFKEPFEFLIGFRKRFYIILLAYILTFISVYVTNFNLGLFALAISFLNFMSFYSDMEHPFYVWSFHHKPKDFLIAKIKTGLKQSSLLSIPIVFILFISFYTEFSTLITFLLICYTYLITFILAKYSNFPKQIEIPQSILLGISFIFPPIVLFIIPYFYKVSIKKLSTLL